MPISEVLFPFQFTAFSGTCLINLAAFQRFKTTSAIAHSGASSFIASRAHERAK